MHLPNQAPTMSRPPEEAMPQEVAQEVGSAFRFRDVVFDSLLPPDLRAASDVFWTPFNVVEEAVRWFKIFRIRTVVDVGSGAGKFCIAAALLGDQQFTGIEHRPRLVTVARALAKTLHVEERVEFLQHGLDDSPLPVADAYYLYNPFGENLMPCGEQLDGAVEVHPERHRRDVTLMRRHLERAAVGTYLLTYHGLGGPIPGRYEELYPNGRHFNLLRIYRKIRPAPIPARSSR
jgi:SAM-dependent methyltransferase